MPRATRGFAALAALLAALFCASVALADGKASPEARHAKALFEEGVALSDQGKWAEALAAFQKSDSVQASATVRFNIATTLRALGRYVEAKSTLDQLLAMPTIKPALRKDAQALLDEVNPKIVVVAVTQSPADASVQMDGAPLARRPDGRLEADPGKHVFVISAAGYDTTTVTATLSTSDKELSLTAPKSVAHVQVVEVKKTPFYARAWFIATVVVAVAGGATVGIVLATRPKDAPPAAPPPGTVDRVLPAGFRAPVITF
jgi:hypothetical protein